jgi:hypothetical protein
MKKACEEFLCTLVKLAPDLLSVIGEITPCIRLDRYRLEIERGYLDKTGMPTLRKLLS